MNPYRETNRSTIEVERGRTRRRVRRKTAGYFLIVLAFGATPWVFGYGTWWTLTPWSCFVAFAILLAFVGRSRSAFVRLCALTWNRGDRLGATLLLFGVITPRYSAKRIARNKAALAAADSGLRTWSG
jgi:hypothetical protein